MNKEFYINNRKKLIEQMSDGEAIILFSGNEIRKTADENYSFFSNRNFVYLTGIYQENSVLVISKALGEVQEKLYLLQVSEDREVWIGRKLRNSEATEISGIENIFNVDLLEQHLHSVIAKGEINCLLFDFDRLSFDQSDDVAHSFADKVKRFYPYIDLKNINPIICEFRKIKEPCEIEAVKKGMQITNAAICSMIKNCKPDMKEYELEAEFNYVLAKHGQRVPAFPSIISSGNRNFYLHYSELMGQIKDGELVLVDVGSGYDGYCTDISRVFPSNGKFSEIQALIYNIALKSNREIMKKIKPGQPFSITNKTCQEVAFEGLRELGLIDDIKDIKKYVWHGTTHYVGLDVHDVGSYNGVMQKNMIFTVDSGIYVREWGIGLRVEDNVLVTENGCENLSKDIPVTIEEIESLMNKR